MVLLPVLGCFLLGSVEMVLQVFNFLLVLTKLGLTVSKQLLKETLKEPNQSRVSRQIER